MRCWGYVEYLAPLPVDHDCCYDVEYPKLTIVIVMNYQLQKDEIIEKNLAMVLLRTNRHGHLVRILVIALIVHFLLNLEFVHQAQHLWMARVVFVYLHWMVMAMLLMMKKKMRRRRKQLQAVLRLLLLLVHPRVRKVV